MPSWHLQGRLYPFYYYGGRTSLWSTNFTRFDLIGYNLKISHLRRAHNCWLIVIKLRFKHTHTHTHIYMYTYKTKFFAFCSGAVAMCVLLVYWMGIWCPTSLDSLVVLYFRVDLQWRRKKLDAPTLKMRPLRCLETSVSIQPVTLSNIPEERELSVNVTVTGKMWFHKVEYFRSFAACHISELCGKLCGARVWRSCIRISW
jgi:hypothetical protein